MRVLYLATLFWGAISTGLGLWMIRQGLALEAWWQLAGIFAGGVLGLFLLGLVSRRADNVAGATAVAIGLLVILWMSAPQFPQWVTVPVALRNPWHTHMTVVVGTLTIFLVGLAISGFRSRADAGGAR